MAMTTESPRSFTFNDRHLGPVRFVQEGQWTGWLFRMNCDGDWVSIRLATAEDMAVIAAAIAKLN